MAATFNYPAASTKLSYRVSRGAPHPLLEDKALVQRDSPVVKAFRGFIDIDVPPAPAPAAITAFALRATLLGLLQADFSEGKRHGFYLLDVVEHEYSLAQQSDLLHALACSGALERAYHAEGLEEENWRREA